MTFATADFDVAVVIPVFNGEQFIERAIDSALSQSSPPSSILVVDDASTDRTADLVMAMTKKDPAIRLLRQQHNEGPSAARNLGVNASSGAYIAFLDADDAWLPNHLAVARAVLSSVERPTVLTTTSRWSTAGENTTLPAPQAEHCAVREPVLSLIKENFVLQSASIVPRSSFELVGGFRTNLRYSEDYDLWMRLAMNGVDFIYCNAVTCLRTRHAGQVSERNAASMFRAGWGIRADAYKVLVERSPDQTSMLREMLRTLAVKDREAAVGFGRREVLAATCDATGWVGLDEDEERRWKRLLGFGWPVRMLAWRALNKFRRHPSRFRWDA